MAESSDNIESFVARLQKEGVEAGRKEAEQMKRFAENEAKQVLAKAAGEGEAILAGAQKEAAQILERGRAELGLAVRDIQVKLREVINQSLAAILKHSTDKALQDEGFLKSLIHEVFVQYVQADAACKKEFRVRIADDRVERLTDWITAELRSALLAERAEVYLGGGLRDGGFEYTVGAGTVEVTAEAIAKMLSELVGPQLKALMQTAPV